MGRTMRTLLLLLTAGVVLLPQAARADCDSARRLEKVSPSGQVVELDNGSRWRIADTDQYVAARWKQDAPITACNDELINREDHESARAEETDPGDES